MSQVLKSKWPSTELGTCEEKWSAVTSALVDTAEEYLGFQTRKQPDWFKESLTTLEPLLQRRSSLYSKWLSSGKESDRRKFAKAQCDARRAVRVAKNEWFRARADEAQRGRFSGKRAWQCIRELQHGRKRGMIPTRCTTIRDEAGTPLTSIQEQQERWRRHFQKVLNVQSQFNVSTVDQARQRSIRSQLEEPPELEEVREAVWKL